MQVFDSLAETAQYHMTAEIIMRKLSKDVFGLLFYSKSKEAPHSTYRLARCEQQTDQHSCGVYALINFIHIVCGQSVPSPNQGTIVTVWRAIFLSLLRTESTSGDPLEGLLENLRNDLAKAQGRDLTMYLEKDRGYTQAELATFAETLGKQCTAMQEVVRERIKSTREQISTPQTIIAQLYAASLASESELILLARQKEEEYQRWVHSQSGPVVLPTATSESLNRVLIAQQRLWQTALEDLRKERRHARRRWEMCLGARKRLFRAMQGTETMLETVCVLEQMWADSFLPYGMNVAAN